MLRIKSKKSKIKSNDSFRVSIKGTVAGSGFKSFIKRAAERRNIKGVLNDESYGILMSVEGDKDKIYDLVAKIYEDKPHSATIDSIDVDQIEYVGYEDFKIPDIDLKKVEHSLAFSDIAICPDCVEELFNQKDRRYFYPFISCSHCGLRSSILNALPYERNNTTMGQFELCPKCLKEYQESNDRRFNNHINSCWDCGPKLRLQHRDSSREYNYEKREALDKAIDLLKKGTILVFKDSSGYKICSSLFSDNASGIIEDNLKDIESYLLVKGIKMVEEYARVNEKERELLLSHRRPKMVLRLLEDAKIPKSIRNEKKYFKFQLPYSGFNYTVFKNIDFPLLVKDCECLVIEDIDPILIGASWALLSHDREAGVYSGESEARVFTSRDGSLSKDLIIRRSKGYIPDSLIFEYQVSSSILALGGSRDSSFTLAKDNKFYISPYLGDLSKKSNQINYKRVLNHYLELFKIEPSVIVVGKKEDSFLSGLTEELSKSLNTRVIEMENNHARVVSTMLENNLDEDVIGFALNNELSSKGIFDFEFSLTSLFSSKILGYFESLGDLTKIYNSYSVESEWLGQVKDEFCKESYPIDIREVGNQLVILSSLILDSAIADMKRAIPQSRIIAKLYNSIVEGVYKVSLRLRRRLKINKISLAGDMLENVFFLTNLYERLKSKDFEVYISGSIPTNDSSISLGQIIVADSIIKEEIKSHRDS
ncbi:MAG: acylphosphatase [Candidatus Kaelpia aquatica]|nr:acylphosphatase [Candidatus Kaelpia aquatica]